MAKRRRRRRRRISLEAVTRIGLLITIILVIILCIVLISRCGKDDELDKVKVPVSGTTTTPSGNDSTSAENTSTNPTDEPTTSSNLNTYGDSIYDDGQVIICIDAGHGGIDGGSVNDSRLEKDDTLKLSLMVKNELEALGATVITTRTADTDIALYDRPSIANDAHADALISIHRNSYAADTSVKGVEAWIASSNPGNSNDLAAAILAGLDSVGVSRNRGVKCGSQGNENEDYAINSQSSMPSLILEFGFITNNEDNNLYDSKMSEYAKSIAKSVYDWVVSQQ